MPALKATDPQTAALVKAAMDAKDHADASEVNLMKMLSDGIYASMLFIPWGTPNAQKIATTAVFAAKGFKAISDGKPKTATDLVLKIATTVEPIITYMNPPVGGTMEVIINLAKLYNDSKLTNANKELYTDLAAAFVPAIKLVHKKTGVSMEVLTKAFKTETGAQAIEYLKIKVSSSPKPSSKDEQLEQNKVWTKLPDTSQSEYTASLHAKLDIENPIDYQSLRLILTEVYKNLNNNTLPIGPSNEDTTKIAEIIMGYLDSPESGRGPENDSKESEVTHLGNTQIEAV